MSLSLQPQPPVAVLWDYDGTLVDTQPIWHQVDLDITGSLGLTWTQEQAFSTIGIGGWKAAKMIIDAVGDPTMDVDELDHRRSSMVAERVAAGELAYLPGAKALVEECSQAGIPCVLVSASPRFVLDAGVERMPPHWFCTTISSDEITENKPSPEAYLLAASLVGVHPEQCLVIEDSAAGCTAGRASRAAVLGIPNMTPLEPHPGQVLRDSLAEVSVDDLPDIYAQARASLRY